MPSENRRNSRPTKNHLRSPTGPAIQNPPPHRWDGYGKRFFVADFNDGTITSDAGALLLDKTEQAIGMLGREAECFVDRRDGDLIEHSVSDSLRQRVFALALGYQDLNDHDELSRDPLLAAVVGKAEPRGLSRRSFIPGCATSRLRGRRGRPFGGSRRCRPSSCGVCRPFAFPGAFAFASRRRHSTWR